MEPPGKVDERLVQVVGRFDEVIEKPVEVVERPGKVLGPSGEVVGRSEESFERLDGLAGGPGRSLDGPMSLPEGPARS